MAAFTEGLRNLSALFLSSVDFKTIIILAPPIPPRPNSLSLSLGTEDKSFSFSISHTEWKTRKEIAFQTSSKYVSRCRLKKKLHVPFYYSKRKLTENGFLFLLTINHHIPNQANLLLCLQVIFLSLLEQKSKIPFRGIQYDGKWVF